MATDALFTKILKRLMSDPRFEKALRLIDQAGGSGVVRLTFGNNGMLIRIAYETEIKGE